MESERHNMLTTLIPDTRDASVDTGTIIDFKETPTAAQQPAAQPLTARRWWFIGGVAGGSIALATAATVVANVIAKRLAEPRQLFGVRPIRRFGMRHVATPRGGSAWLAYTYQLPDLRVRLPEVTLSKRAILFWRGRHR
jgi:hypothetical protein